MVQNIRKVVKQRPWSLQLRTSLHVQELHAFDGAEYQKDNKKNAMTFKIENFLVCASDTYFDGTEYQKGNKTKAMTFTVQNFLACERATCVKWCRILER